MSNVQTHARELCKEVLTGGSQDESTPSVLMLQRRTVRKLRQSLSLPLILETELVW